MNFTGGNTLPNIGRRLSWHLVTLAGGLAIAISAGALAGAFERGASPATTAVTQPVAPSIPVTQSLGAATPLQMVYVITGSEAEAASLRSAISTYGAAFPELAEAAAYSHIVAIENQEQEAQFDTMLAMSTGELISADIGVRVLDLRQPGALPSTAAAVSVGQPAHVILYVVGSQAEAIALRQQFHEAGNEAPGNVLRDVLIIDSTASEEMLATAIGEQMAAGGFEIIDLRI